jgi:hypothetical protein
MPKHNLWLQDEATELPLNTVLYCSIKLGGAAQHKLQEERVCSILEHTNG